MSLSIWHSRICNWFLSFWHLPYIYTEHHPSRLLKDFFSLLEINSESWCESVLQNFLWDRLLTEYLEMKYFRNIRECFKVEKNSKSDKERVKFKRAKFFIFSIKNIISFKKTSWSCLYENFISKIRDEFYLFNLVSAKKKKKNTYFVLLIHHI